MYSVMTFPGQMPWAQLSWVSLDDRMDLGGKIMPLACVPYSLRHLDETKYQTGLGLNRMFLVVINLT